MKENKLKYTSKVNGAANAKCPFFLNEYKESHGTRLEFGVTCEGTEEENGIKLSFRKEADKNSYVEKYCTKYPNECILVKALEEKYKE